MKENKSFTTTILWTFVLLNIVSVMIFTFSVKHEDGERALSSAKTSLKEIVGEKAELISVSLKSVEDKTENMATWMEYFLNEEYNRNLSEEYMVNEDKGILTRKPPNGQSREKYSAVFFPNNIPRTEEILREINATEKMDPIFSDIIIQEKMLKWVYIATEHQFLRVMPFYETDAFAEGHKQTGDAFYEIAIEENNPARKSVWTDPYVDYLGTGWMISCSHPIYDKDDRFFGVVCADVGVEEIRQIFLEGFKLGESGKIYLLSNSGSIIYHPDYQKKAEKQGEMYGKNIFDDEEMSGRKTTVLQKVLQQKEALFQFTDKGQNKMIAGTRIDGQPWTLVIEINTEEFLSQNRIEGKVLAQLIFIGLVLAVVLAVIMYYEFSIPMRTLVNGVKTLSGGGFGKVSTSTSFSEINLLSEAFNNMNDNLQQYMESLLRKNNELTAVLNAIYDVVMIIDTEGNIKISNQKSTDRITREGMNPNKCYSVLLHKEEICENCIINLVLDDKQPVERQEFVEGEIYKNTYYPIIESSGEIKEIVILSQCITKKMAMESELQQVEKMAGIGQFSAAIAHEIKNPLAVIKGAVYIMKTYNKEDAEAGVYTEEIQLVENAVREAEHVISTLLDFSFKETQVGGFIDLSKIVEQILMISRKEIIKKGIEIAVDLQVESFFYKGKLESVKIVLQNLINNAIQAVGEGGMLCVYSKPIKENSLLIGVIDNGCGISIKPKNKIFEPFITTKKESGGSGIGLWISKTLIDGMGGRIWVDEEKTDGTEIKIILPILAGGNNVLLEKREES